MCVLYAGVRYCWVGWSRGRANLGGMKVVRKGCCLWNTPLVLFITDCPMDCILGSVRWVCRG